MSYELVKNINFKKHTIYSATNNIRPLKYSTWEYLKNASDDEFISLILLDIKEGMLHLKNYNLYYLYEIIDNAHIEDDYEKLCDATLTEQEYKELRETIKNKLVSAYHNYKKIDKALILKNSGSARRTKKYIEKKLII